MTDKNRLNGTIPSELGGLLDLTSLQLASNHLTGTVSTFLGALDKLSK